MAVVKMQGHTVSSLHLIAAGGETADVPLTAEAVTAEKTITENGAYTAADEGLDGYRKVNVNITGASANPTDDDNDVIFVDFDGAIRHSYTSAEFAGLTELPPNPSHDGLTAQGWNWTLAESKAYVAKYGRLTIGQNYVTDDGKTRIYARFTDDFKSPKLAICVNGTVSVDWGDGTTTETIAGTSDVTGVSSAAHEYALAGKYVITITPSEGTEFRLGGNALHGTLIAPSSAGASYNAADNRPYQMDIDAVRIGSGCIGISAYALENAASVWHVTIPRSVTAFAGSAFDHCGAAEVTCPPDLASIAASVWNYCLAKYISVNADLPGGSGITNACNYASNLRRIELPETYTVIGNSLIVGCSALREFTVPDTVTAIGAKAFGTLANLQTIRFTAATPPTADANAFQNLPVFCQIHVPEGSLDAYTAAANYPDSTTYTYTEG